VGPVVRRFAADESNVWREIFVLSSFRLFVSSLASKDFVVFSFDELIFVSSSDEALFVSSPIRTNRYLSIRRFVRTILFRGLRSDSICAHSSNTLVKRCVSGGSAGRTDEAFRFI